MNTNQKRLGVPILITENKDYLKKTERKGTLPNSFDEALLHWYQFGLRYHKEATDNTSYKYGYKHPQQNSSKHNSISILKGAYIMTMWDLPRNGRVVQHESINVIQHTFRTKDKKPYESLKRYRKGTWQNSMSFHDKNSQKQGMEGKFLKIIKAIMKTAQLTLYSMVRKRNLSL